MPAMSFYAMSGAQREEMYRRAGNVRSGRSCASWLPSGINIAGKVSIELRCKKNSYACEPGRAGVCESYEREPGADDA